jgi:ribosomal protein S18 acetylase RimI-like enzyme
LANAYLKGGKKLAITYKLNQKISASDALDIYERSGLRRPQDLRRIENMLQHANVVITAWDEDKLVGLLRAMTDFSFDCYLNDLAVDVNYQHQGIGREMVKRLTELLDDKVLIVLISAPTAVGFYEKLGFTDNSEPFGRTMCMGITKNFT